MAQLCWLSSSGGDAEFLLSIGAIEGVAAGNHYMIWHDAASATVLEVYYAESALSAEDIKNHHYSDSYGDGISKRDARRQVALHEETSPKGEGYVRIRIHVKDNGIGMSQEFQEHIFESFTREDNKRVYRIEGTGLGMAITKCIVDAMGGEITVKSRQGEGSEFQVVLDLEKCTKQEEEMILPDWNMLVVDDDRRLCESTVDSLRSIGIRAEWTLDGESAIKLVTQHHARHSDYQIILLD